MKLEKNDKKGVLRFANLEKRRPNIIKVIGVGGGGGNAVKYMFEEGIKDVDFVVCNTDAQALDANPVPIKIQLGAKLTEGMGAGADPEEGRLSAEESKEELNDILNGDTKMVFITAGMGGGTGTGAAPIIAQMCRERDILTVGVVTMPFNFEGNRRSQQAEKGIEELKKYVDTLVVILNDNLRRMHNSLTVSAAFKLADDVLLTAVKGMAELITISGQVNVDFKDAKAVLKNSGVALMGSAEAEGTNRAIQAIEEAVSSPLQDDNNIYGAANILANIVGGKAEVTIDEISEILQYLQDAAGGSANIIYGQARDESLGDKLRVTVIVTGFEGKKSNEKTVQELNQPRVKEAPQEKKVEELDLTEEPEEDFSASSVEESVEEDSFQPQLFGTESPVIEPEIKHFLANEDQEFYNPNLEEESREVIHSIQKKVSKERMAELKTKHRHDDTEYDLNDLDVPAYQRRKEGHADAGSNSSYTTTTLSAPQEDGKSKISKNRFLHRDVD